MYVGLGASTTDLSSVANAIAGGSCPAGYVANDQGACTTSNCGIGWTYENGVCVETNAALAWIGANPYYVAGGVVALAFLAMLLKR
jgi:hypothetical protein